MKEEWLPLVNEEGEIIGKAPRSHCHANKNYLHPVVHLHVINKKGEIFLQKRPENKVVQPGKWDTAVGGHVAFGESVDTSLEREALEEIGISNFKATLIARYIWESDIERELVYCFLTRYDGTLKTDKHELADGRYWSRSEIQQHLNKEVFTPNFEEEYRKWVENTSIG
ncbi:MAG: NUDIX domain-containing protein [Bacteroidales bacterium]|nr:NUDIX domain-containing protein [Bacteroidales bacterium]